MENSINWGKPVRVSFYHSKKRTNKRNEAPIYCRISLLGKNTEISTGIFIPAEDFKNGKIITHTNILTYYQRQIDMLRSRIVEIETDLKTSGRTVTPHAIKQIIVEKTYNKKFYFTDIAKDWLNNQEKFIGIDFKLQNYKAKEKTVGRFIHFFRTTYFRNDFSCNDIKENVMTDFRAYCVSELKFKSTMFRRYVYIIKAIIDYAVLYDYTEKNYLSKYIIKKSRSNQEISYLSLEQIKLLFDAKFASHALVYVRDCFLFQCFTGMSYADLAKFSLENIMQQPNGAKFLIIYRQKNSNKSTIPLLPEAEAIINQYKDLSHRVDMHIKNKGVLPVYSNQAMNRLLKQVGLICNIPTQLLCTHTARKTFATTVINSGMVSIESISKMLGHSKIETTQTHYAYVDTRKLTNEMKDFSFTKLINNN